MAAVRKDGDTVDDEGRKFCPNFGLLTPVKFRKRSVKYLNEVFKFILGPNC